jgi:hypothetical protein
MLQNIFHREKEAAPDPAAVAAAATQVCEWLEAIRQSKADPQRRTTTLQIAGILFSQAHVGPMCDALNDPDAEIRLFAASMLGSFRNAQALESLRAASADPDVRVRMAVLGSLCRQSGIDMTWVNYDPSNDIWTHRPLRGQSRGMTTSHILNQKPSSGVGAALWKPLGSWAVPMLCAALSDPRPVIRAAAVERLAGFRARSAADMVRVLLYDPSEQVRLAARKALPQLGVSQREVEAVGRTHEDVIELAETYIHKAHPLPASMKMMGIQETKPTYQVVSGQVNRGSYPHIDEMIVSTASCLPDGLDITDTQTLATLAFQAIMHYASLASVQAFFLAPYHLRAGGAAKGSSIPPEEQCRLCAGVENLLLEIYDELPQGGRITDEIVIQKVWELSKPPQPA